MSKTRRDKVEEAIKEIRAFYSLGKELWRANPRGRNFDIHFIRDEAERRNTNQDWLRKARVFFDRVAGYSRQELSERHVQFADLPKALKDKITAALTGIKELHGAVEKELKKKEPDRNSRGLSHDARGGLAGSIGKRWTGNS